MRRTPLRRMSGKKRREIRERTKLKDVIQQRSGGMCEMRLPGCTSFATEMHERLPRGRGGDPLDPSNVIHACAACHMWTHLHPIAAGKLGLIVSWKAND